MISRRELIVDNFAGGGGASLGIEMALGRSPDFAINHDAEAIAMHAANHPHTQHYLGDVFDVQPEELCGGRPVGLAWFSPDCTHFSKAKGGKPRDQKIRGLAWIVIRWARTVRPRVIFLENVEEFEDWGPLVDGQPDPLRRGLTYRRWLGQLKAAGYVVESRQLKACDYGAPTTRKRLFIIARCDGQPIVWPEATVAPADYTTAGECIDWSIPTRSIFERKKPLAAPTLRRIARGVVKHVIESASPFILPATHGASGGKHDTRVHDIDDPLRTITTRGAQFHLVAPTLIQTSYGERKGQTPRTLDLHKPLGTVVAGGIKHALVSAFIVRHFGGDWNSSASLHRPLHTITAKDHHGLVCAFLMKYYGTSTAQSLREPLSTITADGVKHALVTVNGARYRIADIGMRMLVPRELYRAQGFCDEYIIDPIFEGKPLTKTAQVRMVGNSVSPSVACALVAANCARGYASEVA